MLALLGAIFVLLRSPFGASVQAIRDDEEAAASIGVKVLAAKRTMFILAAFGCALAGVLWLATSITFQPKTNFGVQWTAYMILMALVGGLGTFEGPILGALFFFLVQNEFGENGVWYMAGSGRRSPSCSRCSCRAASGASSRRAPASGFCRSAIGCA